MGKTFKLDDDYLWDSRRDRKKYFRPNKMRRVKKNNFKNKKKIIDVEFSSEED